MKSNHPITLLRLALLISLFFTWTTARAKTPIVYAVLFYSPSCPHCHKVITEDLTPLVEKYGEQLFLIAIDTSVQQGGILYQSAIQYYEIPENRLGVPTLIVGDTVLVGSAEIPGLFPDIVENGLAKGGIAWPEIPELRDLLEMEGLLDQDQNSSSEEKNEDIPEQSTEEEIAPVNPGIDESGDSALSEEPDQTEGQSELTSGEETTQGSSASQSDEEISPDNVMPDKANNEPEIKDPDLGVTNDLDHAVSVSENLTLVQRFGRDKTGNSVSIIVLFGMVFSVLGVGTTIFHTKIQPKRWPNRGVLILILIGAGVALYMAFIEVSNTKAVCGPVGDCNTVQQSPYATLFGVIPIGVLGVFGYLIIGILWLIVVKGPSKWQRISTLCLLALTLFGTVFSIYLTFLEPFVIGATCAWCLTSAIVMTLLLWAAIEPASRFLCFTDNDRRLT
jgi:uncharacterized membrane protein/thiol-disulfide isomerase/thioredoxin